MAFSVKKPLGATANQYCEGSEVLPTTKYGGLVLNDSNKLCEYVFVSDGFLGTNLHLISHLLPVWIIGDALLLLKLSGGTKHGSITPCLQESCSKNTGTADADLCNVCA